jgi:hypothetical protein
MVVLADGRTTPIDHVRIGDRVLTTDPATGKSKAERVTAISLERDSDLLDLTLRTRAGESVVHTTEHHLFYDLTTRRWTEAGQLRAGERLYTPGGGLDSVVALHAIRASAEMWDLTVNGEHDFYIAAPPSTVLVHNCPAAEDPAAGSGEKSLIDRIKDLPTTIGQEIGSRYPQATDKANTILGRQQSPGSGEPGYGSVLEWIARHLGL